MHSSKSVSDALSLICFFSLNFPAQWKYLPDNMKTCWIHIGDVDTDATQPLEFLCLLLYGLLTTNDISYALSSNDNALEIIQDAKCLLSNFILDSFKDSIFVKKEFPDDVDRIWNIFSLLMTNLLIEVKLSCKNSSFDFEYFIRSYSTREVE